MKHYWSLTAGLIIIIVVAVIVLSLLYASSMKARENMVHKTSWIFTVSSLFGGPTWSDAIYDLGTDSFQTDNYDVDRALYYLERYMAEGDGQYNYQALYTLTRVYLVRDELDKALATADAHLRDGAGWDRMYYVRGLVNAYAHNYEQAEDDFRRFIAYAPEEWAGYLDLSWVLFQVGKTVEAGDVLRQGLDKHPDNPWLLSAWGVLQYNYQQLAKAKITLERALELSQNITPEQWRESYSANDPKNTEEELRQFQEVIRYNISLVDDSYVLTSEQISDAFNAPFANVGGRGLKGGLHVSACDSSTCHDGCGEQCNVCGDCQCVYNHDNGRCDLGAPTLPAGFGQGCVAQNRCGQSNAGTVGCDGTCTIGAIPEIPLNPTSKATSSSPFHRVEHGDSVYIYEPALDVTEPCYLYTNNNVDGRSVFLPLGSLAEFQSFATSSFIVVPTLGNTNVEVTATSGIFDLNGDPITP